MLVVISRYVAKVGEEDAVIALHENAHHAEMAKDYLSWELLRKVEAPREFIAIAHYASEEVAKEAENNLVRDAWFIRLMSLLEEASVHTYCIREWGL